MPISIVVSFVVVFALALLAVSVGLKYFDARRKSQVVGMLHTASGESAVSVSNLLKEIETEKPSGFKRLHGGKQPLEALGFQAVAFHHAVFQVCGGTDPAGRLDLVGQPPDDLHGPADDPRPRPRPAGALPV